MLDVWVSFLRPSLRHSSEGNLVLGMIPGIQQCSSILYCYTFAFQNETSYRKQREEGGAKREPERVRETEKRGERQDTNSRGREKHSNSTSFWYLSTQLRAAAVGCLGGFGVRARCCGAYHTVPVGWPGVDVLLLSFPFRFFLFCCCCCYLLGLCSADGSLLRGRICA